MRLKEARKRRNLKQAQVADYLGIPLRTYQNYEREVNDPDSFILCKLADFYDVTTDYLLELTDIPNSIGQYHLKREEYELVTLYRRMDEDDRQGFMVTARALAYAGDAKKEESGASALVAGGPLGEFQV